MTGNAHSETRKTELRREQVLKAATECFRREGFNGSSIARISQAAGMSPGNIYRYFDSKEAIVEAIANLEEIDTTELRRKLEQDRSGDDLVTMLTRRTAEMVERHTDTKRAGLTLELAAEAARNPAVMNILRRAHESSATRFHDLIARIGAPEGLDDAELRTRLEVIATMFNGLVLRSQIDPDLDRRAMTRLINDLIHFLLERSP